MSFLDNIKSRMKGGDAAAEEEFQRGLREGSWPEGIDDFKLMDNTGTFLPAVPDRDPLEEANAFAGQGAASDDDGANWSVVRAAGSSRTEAPARPEGRFTVIEGNAGVKPIAAGSQAARPAADDGVQVMPRSEARPTSRDVAPAAAQKSYAERLRERVAAADVAGADEPGDRLQVSRPGRPAAAPARAPKAAAPAPAPTAPVSKAPASKPAAHDAGASELKFSSDAVIVRTRTYDDVRKIASVLLNDRRPVVLAMRGTSDAVCQRILDFCFGVCCAAGATFNEIGQKVFTICPKGVTVSDATMADLKRQGILR